MIPIETARLVLRNFIDDDWESLHEMITQYQASEYAAYDQQWPTSAEEIKGITNWFASGDEFLAVCLQDTGQFIGFVALNPDDRADGRQYSIGYVFNSQYQGRGYATEACQAILGHAFNQLQAQKLVTATAEVNRPSRRLLERLGFQKTAENMASFRTSADGKPIEFLGYSYALTKPEWEKANARE